MFYSSWTSKISPVLLENRNTEQNPLLHYHIRSWTISSATLSYSKLDDIFCYTIIFEAGPYHLLCYHTWAQMREIFRFLLILKCMRMLLEDPFLMILDFRVSDFVIFQHCMLLFERELWLHLERRHFDKRISNQRN